MTTEEKPQDDDALTAALADVIRRSQALVAQYLERAKEQDFFQVLDARVIAGTFQELAAKALENPAGLIRAQMAFWADMTNLWQRSLARAVLNQPIAPVIEPAPEDRRFKSELWVENVVFDTVKQAYLLAARHMLGAVAQIEGVDPHTARKARFYTRQFVDAMAPTNFAATNPEVLKRTVESKGENLVKGMTHLVEDLERGHGRLALKMTDASAFRLGETLAVTPGKVVFQNELMQLIQYAPSTPDVYKRPLLIVPPWINKFYILDLKPKNSFIKYVVDQGHTLFVISWVNPDASFAHKTFADYMRQGPLAALDAVREATGERDINLIGYCIGGTLTAATLAWMAAQREKGRAKAHFASGRVASVTFLTSLLDFAEVGEVSVFIDEEQLALLEEHMARTGYLEGHHMADAFNLLRENDLIWSFVVNNYLMGREPMPFDILHWNSDSTRMPAAMHGEYLRRMYLENKLRQPGGIELAGVPIDLGRIKQPAYFLSTREDHIAPWRSTYAGARLLGGPVRFVLGASGHVAGVVNPPAAKKYGHWSGEGLPESPEAWLAAATQHPGSWWEDWARWIAPFGGKRVPPRTPAGTEDAPGSYVKVRIAS
jgi:polyhydroxyalkanoate synthase